jgi:hypothetical protein
MMQAAVSQLLQRAREEFIRYRSIVIDLSKVAAIIALSLFFNMLFNKFFVAPVQQNQNAHQDVSNLIELKPRLEGLLSESETMMNNWMASSWKIKEPMHAIEQLQQLARKHDIKIKETRLISNTKELNKGMERKSGESFEVPISLEVSGNFNKLGRWLNELENQPLVRIEKSKFQASTGAAAETQMSLEIQVLVPQS